MLRKILCLICVFALCFSLCGCNLFTADTAELLSPPALTGDMLPIDEAIKDSVKGDYTHEYPSRGDYRSAVVLHDLNKDGVMEAFAFYSTQAENSPLMNINLIEEKGEKWRSVATADISAGGVDRIDFWDLNHDGVDEILVGWEIYGTSELQLAVYALKNKKLERLMLEQYTHYVPCDLNEDDMGEIVIVRSSPSESKNTAHLFSLEGENLKQTGGCNLDSTAKTLNHPVLSTLSTGRPAIYIDEIKGAGAVTEVIFLEQGSLVNPMMDINVKETTVTLRSAAVESCDINSDGILEIPIQREIPSVSGGSEEEPQYITDWCSFNGEKLTAQLTAIMNLNDRYYYSIPKKWEGKIAVMRNEEASLLEIYRYNPKTKKSGERLLYFKAVSKADFDAGRFSNQDVTEIVNTGDVTYICNASPAAIKDGVDIDKIKNDFKLY